MNTTSLLLSLLVLGFLTVATAQEPSPSPSPTPSNNNGASSQTMLINQGMDTSAGTGANPLTLSYDPQPTPTPALARPNTQALSIYRSSLKSGISVANGAVITFPDLPAPKIRSVSTEQNNLTVNDEMDDGSFQTTSWSLSYLTDPYMQQAPPKGAQLNVLDPDTDPDDANHKIIFDRLPREQMLTYNPLQPNDPNYDSDSTIFLGSVFVDSDNRVIFTPPSAFSFYEIPPDVDQVNCVTLTARNGITAFEYSKNNDANYHVIGVNTDSKSVVFDFAPEDSLEAHEVLSWIDNNHLLGEFAARGSSLYSTLDISSKVLTDKVSANSERTRIVNGHVNIYDPLATQ